MRAVTAARAEPTGAYWTVSGPRRNGWRAVCPWPGPSFTEAGTGFGNPISSDKLAELDAHGWELYHTDVDRAELHDLAETAPDKVAQLRAAYERWATATGRKIPGR